MEGKEGRRGGVTFCIASTVQTNVYDVLNARAGSRERGVDVTLRKKAWMPASPWNQL